MDGKSDSVLVYCMVYHSGAEMIGCMETKKMFLGVCAYADNQVMHSRRVYLSIF